jgi:hypothetical protein
MGVDIGGNNIMVPHQCRRDPPGSGANFEHPVPGFCLIPRCFEKEEGIGLGLVHLGGIAGHDTELWDKRGEKGIASLQNNISGQVKEDSMDAAIKVKWLIDLLMGISFLICFVTGLLKYQDLLQVTGLNNVVLPFALISDLHDWTGLLMGFFVFLHLVLNRHWILATTKKFLAGNR